MEQKSPDAFRTISEVAEWLGVPTHVLRFWESRFTQVKPVKRAGGRRYYRPADMALLGGIRKLLHEDGLTIRGVQKLLREEGVKHVASMSPPLAFDPGETAEVISLTPGGDTTADAQAEDAQSADEAPLFETSLEADDQAWTSDDDGASLPDDASEADFASDHTGFEQVRAAPEDISADSFSPQEIETQVARVAETPAQHDADHETEREDTTLADAVDEAEPQGTATPAPEQDHAQEEPEDAEPAVVTSGLLPSEDDDANPRDTIAPFTIVSDAPEPAPQVDQANLMDAAPVEDDPLSDLEAIAAALELDDPDTPDADADETEISLFGDDVEDAAQTEGAQAPGDPEPDPDIALEPGPILVMPDIPDDPADGALPPLMAPVAPRLRSLRAQNHALAPAALRTLSDQLKMLAQNRDQRPGI